jgi:two-component system, NarL family, invasion response regulator UvrY
VDDHPIVRKGLRNILTEYPFAVAVEEASSGHEALAKVAETRFDMVLLDISMPQMDGFATLERIRKLAPSLPVLILTVYPEEEYAVRALKTGASGYMTKQAAPDELFAAIRKIMHGGRYISPSLADILATDVYQSKMGKPFHETLSNRELIVMKLIVSGRSLKEISAELSLNPKTVSTYRSRILKKVHVSSNAELIRYCLKHDLLA